jgi:hypothetical protein
MKAMWGRRFRLPKRATLAPVFNGAMAEYVSELLNWST